MVEIASSNESPTFTVSIFADVAVGIVGAYVAENSVPLTDLPALIRSVHDTLANLGRPASVDVASNPLMPAVSVRKSITDDHLISLEDGKPYKALKRHLRKFGMTPDSYRAKWGLPDDYPMVSPAYSRTRSTLAKELGLGSMRRKR